MKKNLTKGVITELLETEKKKSSFSVFRESLKKFEGIEYNGHDSTSVIRSEVINDYKKSCSEYENLLSDPEVVRMLNKFRQLENLIIQSENILNCNVKLGMVNQKRGGSETSYIIGRCFFYNPDNVKDEIRVYIGKTEEIGRSLEELSSDAGFMKKTEELLVTSMKEIFDIQRKRVIETLRV